MQKPIHIVINSLIIVLPKLEIAFSVLTKQGGSDNICLSSS